MRTTDLARRHGLSTQAVRNYEAAGFLPPAARTSSGYRVYTDVHAGALDAFLALVRAFGHARAGEIMVAVNEGRLDDAFAAVDRGHGQLARDRSTLATVRGAVGSLVAPPVPGGRRTVGELAHRLGVTAATVRSWEDAGILAPPRDPATGYRVYGPDDVRDADLTHLLRRGGYPLSDIATIVREVRTAGGTATLAAALDGWQRGLVDRGRRMLDAAAALSVHLATSPGSVGGRR